MLVQALYIPRLGLESSRSYETRSVMQSWLTPEAQFKCLAFQSRIFVYLSKVGPKETRGGQIERVVVLPEFSTVSPTLCARCD